MINRALVYATGLAFIISAAASTACAVSFQITDLTQFNPYMPGVGGYLTAKGISANGQYITGNIFIPPSPGDYDGHWDSHRYTVGESVPSVLSSQGGGGGMSVNNSGQVAGVCIDNIEPTIYASHTYISDAAPGINTNAIWAGAHQPPSFYASINNSGQVSATAYYVESVGGDLVEHKYLMYYDGTTGNNLGLTDQILNWNTEINDSSWIVGTVASSNPDLTDEAFVNKPDGLGGRETVFLGVNSIGNDINNSGKIVGAKLTPGLGVRAFISVPTADGYGLPQDLGEVEGYYSSTAKSINNNNWVVGQFGSGFGFLAMDEGNGYVMHDLNSLLSPSDQAIWTIVDAYSVADTGQIIVTAYNMNEDTNFAHDLLLTPIPEPSTLALLAAGAIMLICFIWQKRRGT